MNFLGDKIKPENRNRIFLLLFLGVLWRICLGSTAFPIAKERYLFPIIGFFLLTIIAGELTRKTLGFFSPKKTATPITASDPKADATTLNYATIWALLALGKAFFDCCLTH